jgi:hypothetical protein
MPSRNQTQSPPPMARHSRDGFPLHPRISVRIRHRTRSSSALTNDAASMRLCVGSRFSATCSCLVPMWHSHSWLCTFAYPRIGHHHRHFERSRPVLHLGLLTFSNLNSIRLPVCPESRGQPLSPMFNCLEGDSYRLERAINYELFLDRNYTHPVTMTVTPTYHPHRNPLSLSTLPLTSFFHALPHSFAPRTRRNSLGIRGFRALFAATGVRSRLPRGAQRKSLPATLTYGSPRKCCKQKTYGMARPFRDNTYKN